MFSLKNLVFQVLILAIMAALINCSPTNRLANEVSRRSQPAANDTVPTASVSGNVNILNQAEFKASGLTIITPAPAAENPDGLTMCATTVASPWIWNVRKLADWFNNFNGWYCCNWHGSGGDCSTLMTVEDATTAICGNQGCIRCEDVRDNLHRIVDFCKWNNKAGGVSFLDQGSHVIVY